MKKFLPVLYCAVFIAACLFFAAGVFLPAGDTDAEGRDLAPFPALRTEEGVNLSFFTGLDAYITDHFSARQTLIRWNSRIRETVFRTGSDQVIVGKDGFLFYADTAPDFTGESLLSEEEIEKIADALRALSDYAAERGAVLVFTAAPNKNTVYADKMPAVYRRYEGKSNMDALYAALGKRCVRCADLRDALTAAAETEPVYHRRDTHWNGRGALIAYREILAAAGLVREDFAGCTFTDVPGFPGDLDEMLYPGAGLTETDYQPDFDFSSAFIYTSPYASAMDMSVTTAGAGEGRVLVFRDSFGSALIPYFAAAFAEARFERATPYRMELLNTYKADVVVIEIAERNIHTLADAAARITDP